MSCILVALFSTQLKVDSLSIGDVAACIIRDILLQAWYTYLLINVQFLADPIQQRCYQSSGETMWLYMVLFVGLLRLVKNPLQWLANQEIERNGSRWRNPTNSSSLLAKLFSPSTLVCQMRIYTLVDTMSYFPWIFGLAVLKGTEDCDTTFWFQACFIEVFGSTVLYILVVMSFSIAFAIHRSSNGRLLPGFVIYRADDSCPFFYFDRTQWRQPGEDLQTYRTRVVEHFNMMENIYTQPIVMHSMRTGPAPLTYEELSQLKTFKFHSKIRPSPSAVSLNGTLTRITRKSSVRSIRSAVSRKPSPLVEPKVRTLSRKFSDVSIKQIDLASFTEAGCQDIENNTGLIADKTTADSITTTSEVIEDTTGRHEMTTDDTCALCIEEYEENDLLRELFCGHRFHSDCVDEWLTQSKRICPACNADALGKPGESVSP